MGGLVGRRERTNAKDEKGRFRSNIIDNQADAEQPGWASRRADFESRHDKFRSFCGPRRRAWLPLGRRKVHCVGNESNVRSTAQGSSVKEEVRCLAEGRWRSSLPWCKSAAVLEAKRLICEQTLQMRSTRGTAAESTSRRAGRRKAELWGGSSGSAGQRSGGRLAVLTSVEQLIPSH